MAGVFSFKSKYKGIVSCGFSISLWFCASSDVLAQPSVAQAEEVQTCQYLDQIEGSSGYGKNYNWTVLAKSSAMQKAEKLAATHIVWVRFDPTGGFNGVAVAKAYQCKAI